MFRQHQDHTFVPSSIKHNISFCIKCGCLSINSLTTVKPPQFINKPDTDPLSTFSLLNNALSNKKFSNGKGLCKLSNFRPPIISIIKYVSNKYELDEKVYHSSIYLMDYLRLEMNYMDDFKVTTLVCIILVTKFIGDAEKGRAMERELFTLRGDRTYPQREGTILKLIGYKMNFVTAFDIMTDVLYNGIIFSDDDNTRCVDKIYLNCLLQLNAFVEKQLFLSYTPIQIVFAIVSFNRELYGLNDRTDLFEKIYNIRESLYEDCLKKLRTKVKVQRKVSDNANVVHA
mgnify:CR=1 FL=1